MIVHTFLVGTAQHGVEARLAVRQLLGRERLLAADPRWLLEPRLVGTASR